MEMAKPNEYNGQPVAHEVYSATMNSDLIGPINRMVYDTLYRTGPMTAGQLDLTLDKKNSSARLNELAFFGVVEKAGEITCPVAKRKTTLWQVTGNSPTVKHKDRVYYPSPHELNGFIRDLTIMLAQVRTSNARIPIEFKNVMTWLKAGAPCKHENHVLVRTSKFAKKVKSNV